METQQNCLFRVGCLINLFFVHYVNQLNFKSTNGDQPDRPWSEMSRFYYFNSTLSLSPYTYVYTVYLYILKRIHYEKPCFGFALKSSHFCEETFCFLMFFTHIDSKGAAKMCRVEKKNIKT